MTRTLPYSAGSTRFGDLRFWLGADAVVTGVNAVAYLAAAPFVVDLIGASSGVVRAAGAFLLAFTAYVAFATVRDPERRHARMVVAVNVGWVVGSVVVVVVDAVDLTAVGTSWVLAQAVVVGGLALQQHRTLP